MGFKEWIKSIEKYALLTDADGAQTKHIAYQASKVLFQTLFIVI